MTTQTQTQTQKQGGVRSFLRERAPSARTRVSGKDKASVIASIAAALKAGNFPSMDERLKGIVASQIGDLLRGGFRLDEIRYAAVELGLSWDQKRGHNRLCHLAARVRSEFWSEQQADHADAILAERSETMDIAGKPHPNAHPYASDGNGSCLVCTGPFGVHVRRAVVV